MGRPAAMAVYFSAMVECFSLIPWITAILGEIHRGQWRREPAAPVRSAASGGRTTPDPWRPVAGRDSRPEREGPELPIPGVSWWGYLLLGVLLALAVGLLVWGTASPGEPAPGPRRMTAGETPVPSLTVIPAQSAEPLDPELRELPAPLCENDQWSVYMDSWAWADIEQHNSIMELSFYDREGLCCQTLQTAYESIGPLQPGYIGPQSDEFATLMDLNFDGVEDLRLVHHYHYYKAFLWDQNTQQFVEEPTFSAIRRPYPMNGLIFGCGSSGASNTYYAAYSYNSDTGYQLAHFLSIDISYPSEEETQIIYTQSSYQNGEVIDTVETGEDLSQSDFWRDYVDYCNEYVWG